MIFCFVKNCKVKTKVIDSRERERIFVRRRECPKCKKRYNTKEVIEKETTRK